MEREAPSSELDNLRYAIKHDRNLSNVRASIEALLTEHNGDTSCLEKSSGEEGFTPLTLAIYQGRGDVVGMLLEAGASGNTPVGSGTEIPPLMANNRDRVAAVGQLLSAGAGRRSAPDLRWEGTTPLQLASTFGDIPIARQLLAAGVDTGRSDSQGWTALHYAAHVGHLPLVRALLEANAPADAAEYNRLASPLFFASKGGHSVVVEALLSAGATVDSLALHAVSPLQAAAEQGRVAVIPVLVANGANVERAGGIPLMTPLLAAAHHGRSGAVYELLRVGASVNAALELARQGALPEAAYRLKLEAKRFFDSQRVPDVMTMCDHVCWAMEGRSQQQGGLLQRGMRKEALAMITASMQEEEEEEAEDGDAAPTH